MDPRVICGSITGPPLALFRSHLPTCRFPSKCKTRIVDFFSDLEPPDDAHPRPEPQRVRWRGDPDDTAGVPVALGPLLVHTDQAAVIVSGFFAYPTGFAFSLVAISRLNPAPSPLGFLRPGMGGRNDSTGGELRFGIGFADGSRAMSRWNSIPSANTSVRSLHLRGGRGGGRKWSQEFWCEPLPPAGPMAFVFEWRDFEVAQTSIEVDAAPVLDAASHAAPLWPDDVDLPEDPNSPARGSGAQWNSSSYGRMRP